MATVTWMRDLKAESTCEQLGLSYETIVLEVNDIDWRESHTNGARLEEPFVPHLIADYKSAMISGDTFPMIVVARGVSGVVILSGNQRSEAVRRLIDEGKVPATTKIEAYCIDTTDQLMREVFARSGNVSHGGRSDIEERKQHAIYAHRSLGLTVADAARIFNVADSTINMAIRCANERKSLAESGVPHASLPNSVINEVSKINDHPSKVKLAHLASRHKLCESDVRDARKAVNAAKSQKGRNERIKTLETHLKEQCAQQERPGKQAGGRTAPKTPRRPWRDRIIRDLHNLAHFLEAGRDGEPFTSLAELQVADDKDREAVSNYWARVKLHMAVITKNGGR